MKFPLLLDHEPHHSGAHAVSTIWNTFSPISCQPSVCTTSRHWVLWELKMCMYFDPVTLFWRINFKDAIEAVLWDCMARLQNISSVSVISRTWIWASRNQALASDWLDSNLGSTVCWLWPWPDHLILFAPVSLVQNGVSTSKLPPAVVGELWSVSKHDIFWRVPGTW